MIGSLFKIKDKFWSRDYKRGSFFAWNKHGSGVHPAVIKSFSDGICQLAPGTSRRQQGSCIFRTSIVSKKKSYFVLNKSLPVLNEEIEHFDRGWGNSYNLSQEQINELILQNEFCTGKKIGISNKDHEAEDVFIG